MEKYDLIIVGAGPAGIFTAVELLRRGSKKHILLVEKGRPVEKRHCPKAEIGHCVNCRPTCAITTGFSGAGAFSDGKLNTGTKDTRARKVLEEFAAAGAPEEILFQAKPHIGTDRLRTTVKNLRRTIIALGGEVRFETQMTRLQIHGGKITGVELFGKKGAEVLETSHVILAVGHSARDTFQALLNQGVVMEQKPFSVGARIEHSQKAIDRAQYGRFAGHPALGPADYKLAVHLPNGRGVYTFCMCPGGQVVASASEPGQLVTNGMSYRSRDGENINGGFLVGVGPEDFQTFGADPLAGVRFQEQWERAAFQAGGGGFMAPAQRVEDFLAKRASQGPGEVRPTYQPGVTWTTLEDCLPDYVTDTLRGALPVLDRKLHGFAHPDGGAHRGGDPVVLSGADRPGRDVPVQPAGVVSLRRGCRICGRHHECRRRWPAGGPRHHQPVQPGRRVRS